MVTEEIENMRYNFAILKLREFGDTLSQETEIAKKDYISNVFENQVSVILKNNNVGADCIEQSTF